MTDTFEQINAFRNAASRIVSDVAERDGRRAAYVRAALAAYDSATPDARKGVVARITEDGYAHLFAKRDGKLVAKAA